MFLICTEVLGESVRQHYNDLRSEVSEKWSRFSEQCPKTAYAAETGLALASCIGSVTFDCVINVSIATGQVACAATGAGVDKASEIVLENADTLYSKFSAAYPKTASAISTTASWTCWGAGVAWSAIKLGASLTWWGAKTAYDSLDSFMQRH